MRLVSGFQIGAAFFLAVGSSALGGNADFTVSLEPATDPGANYTDFHEAGAGTNPVFTIGFQIDITQLNGSPVSFTESFASFCVELQEGIGEASYQHDFVGLSQVSRGRAGEAGTASSAIPAGGIGDLAAARVRALFDNHYTSSLLTDWTFSETSPNTQAFQLALWEVSHDSDLNITDTNGSIYIGQQSNTTRDNALGLAQTWLDELGGVTTSYVPTTWDVWALEDAGNPGDQDILFATGIGSQESAVIGAAVPEPTSGLLVLVGMVALGVRRRRP